MNLVQRSAVAFFLSLCLAGAVRAQAVAGSFTPNPAPPGAAITFTGTDSTGGGLNLPSPCTWYRIRPGTPAAPPLSLGIGCPAVIVPVAPNGTFSFSWDQTDSSGTLVPPGLYWVETFVFDPSFSTTFTDFFCISIQPAGAPALVQNSPAQVGQSASLTISSPAHPGAAYLTALSATSNTPFTLFGQLFCLSPDNLFNISILNPASVMSSWFGFLDATGTSSGLAVDVPADPSLAYLGFHAQAVIAGPAGFVLTNDLSFTIQP